MTSRSVTIALDNKVELEVFAETLGYLTKLLRALVRNEQSQAPVQMSVEYLSTGSAAAGAALESEDAALLESVSDGFLRVGAAMSQDNLVQFPRQIAQSARGMLRAISRGAGHQLTMSNDETDIIVLPTTVRQRKNLTLRALGALEGHIQTLSSRDRLNFILYEGVHDYGVRCYLAQDQHDLVRDLRDRRAIVEGVITRDALSGRPFSIRQIRAVTPLPERDPLAYQRAMGILKPLLQPGDTPEGIIRRWRDA